jgi:hypothetical protein
MKSFEKPTAEEVEAARPLLSSPQHEAYFFEHLENPHWIVPLSERGFFDHPPAGESMAGGGVRFPRWHASRYLARMAGAAPTIVANLLSNVKTDNALVNDDIVYAALAMHSSQAATLVAVISDAARTQRLWNSFEKACALCVRLAKDGETESSVKLAKALFGPIMESEEDDRGRRDVVLYGRTLEEVVEVLVAKNHGFLTPLCKWLRTLVRQKKHVDRETGFDHSYSWRPAIEECDQNSEYDFAAMMVGIVRAAFELAIRAGLGLKEALSVLDRYQYLVFKRLRLYLINEFADQDPELARSTLLDPELFDDYKFIHEYGKLTERRFGLLNPDQREQWFSWVEAGPDMSGFDESVQEAVGREATESDRQGRIDYWKFEKLHWVRDHLDGARKAFYDRMIAEKGEPKLAFFRVYSGPVRWGWQSPTTVEELSEMGFEKAVKFAASWKPKPGDHDGPSLEGLAEMFEQFVATDPSAFSAQARLLIGKPAYIVRPFVTKMSSAVGGEAEIDLGAVFDVCGWVIKQPNQSPAIADPELDDARDENWQYARSEIFRLLKAVCLATTSGTAKYSVTDFRTPVWDLISPLCNDPAASSIVFDVEKQDPRLYDYVDLGINSDRGKAIDAVLEYARWVANHLKEKEGEIERVPGGFESMPEVRAALEGQLAPDNRNFEVLAIIGLRLDLIYSIDKDWLSANTDGIFQLEEVKKGFAKAQGWAAWNAFLVWHHPHIDFFELFKPQFDYAVTQASKVQPNESGRQQPMYHLGEHLLVLYGRGQLGLEEGSLVRRFVDTATSSIRRHAMRFIGLTLENSPTVPDDILKRFQALWTTYWSTTGKGDAQEKPTDSLFGDWFTSAKFPDEWALERLEEFVEVVPTPSPDYEIVGRLAAISATDPAGSARILDKMVRGDNEGWRPAGWNDSAQSVLEVALAAGGEARTVAQGTIEFLGRRGYMEVGELLKNRT